jgi:polyvinyl alcohol dehydrogenase (cytochrome)
MMALPATGAESRPDGADEPVPGSGYCSGAMQPFSGVSGRRGWNGWGVTPDNARFQAVDAGLNADNVSRLRLKWAFGFAGMTLADSQPAISHGILFIGSQSGAVYALDARAGCIRWVFKARAAVRTGFAIGPAPSGGKGSMLIYFGDQRGAVYALDARSGQLRWRMQADAHPATMITGTPQLWEGRLFVPVASYEENFAPDPRYQCCTFRGSVAAYEATTGRLIWKTHTISARPRMTHQSKAGTQLWGPSGAAVWSAPTLDPQKGVLYVGTGNNYSDPITASSDAIVAMSMVTGKILWIRQLTSGDAYNGSCEDFLDATHSNCPPDRGSDFDFGAPPILSTDRNGHRFLVAAQKSGFVYGLDPSTAGTVLWRTRVAKGGPLGGIEWGAASDGENVYIAVSDCDWKTFERRIGGKVESYVDMDPEKGGGLSAIRVNDGSKLWDSATPRTCGSREHCSPAQLAPVTAIPGVVFSGSLDGHLRAYSSRSGDVLWDYDTSRDFSTVNGVAAHGGSLNGAGATVVDGMVYVNSGYSLFGEAPGNVLLAFSAEGN